MKLSDVERQELEKLVKRHQVGQQIALRTRIVLAAADGLKNKEIVAKYSMTADTVRLWRNRWVKLQDISLNDLSIEDRLQDAPRPGAPLVSLRSNTNRRIILSIFQIIDPPPSSDKDRYLPTKSSRPVLFLLTSATVIVFSSTG